MRKNIALAGNPNCGKTTLFNELTGANQYVGNWPGVTVDRKGGQLTEHEEIELHDLPGIYSLSPYSPEEVVSRRYLLEDKPDIEENDYWENIALVGKTLAGKPVIAILDNVICTSGFEPETKNKEGAVVKLTFECHGELGTHTDTLPWRIYYPKAV